jgi:hypothetical protein
VFIAGRKLSLKRKLFSPHPSFKEITTGGLFMFFILCVEKNKIKCHSFFGRGDPSPTVEAHLL